MKELSVTGVNAVFGKGEHIYNSVLDDFNSTSFIGIMTFNISTNSDSKLLSSLKEACLRGTEAVVITNIPKRFKSYYKEYYALAAKKTIDLYLKLLNPQDYGMRLSPFFSFNNHSKIIITDNIVYWGSSNFSDESRKNLECGSISTDKELISYLKESLFIEVQESSVPYYHYNFASAIVNLDSLIPLCKSAKEQLFASAFEPWSEYETGFNEKWIYRTTDSGLTSDFLQGFISRFSDFEDALDCIDEILDRYFDSEDIPEDVEKLEELYKEYKKTFDNFNEAILSLFDELEEVARYNASEEACRKIDSDYGMEAFDEHLDYYAEKAIITANEEYEMLIEQTEQTVKDSLEYLDDMVQYFEQLKAKLVQLLEPNKVIDNTGV